MYQFQSRGTLIEIHIADIHFGARNVPPNEEYQILIDQFINKIMNIKFDILSINGDLFDRKFPSNSDAIMYALMFVNQCVSICRNKMATLIIISGTGSHDADQIKLCNEYIGDPTVDVRVITSTQFIYVKGAKILCIPEEYGKGEEYYRHFLFDSDTYDSVFMHGTIKNSIYGADKEYLNSPRAPVFSIDSFDLCQGPIIAGHVHTGGCFDTYMYYCSSPIRFRHGEEEPKGFLILLHNLDNRRHYVHFEPIISYEYKTIEINGLNDAVLNDPDNLVNYINSLQDSGIHFIRLTFSNIPENTQLLIKEHYKHSNNITFKNINNPILAPEITVSDKYNELDFLLDSNLNEYDKFVRFVNYNEGEDFITVNKLKELLRG